MDPDALLHLLRSVADGDLSPADALHNLERLPFGEVEAAGSSGAAPVARVDHHRMLRTGFPEVIYCPGKTAEQVADIAAELLAHGDVVLATRIDGSQAAALAALAPDTVHHERAGVAVIDRRTQAPSEGHIVIATGGTADQPVAEEAAVSAEVMGNRVTRLYDVGVAGLHRLLAHSDVIDSARVVIAVAGMEGALPSVVAGLVRVPVVAVPTSVGYGANFGGVSALLTMLNSCAGGIGVVNIDNGFGAAVLASRINQPAVDRATVADGDTAAGLEPRP